MDLQSYIANGTVIDYYLGHLQEQDRLEFEIALELYPQLKEELHMLHNSLDKDMKNKSVPADGLKDKIWSTLQNLILEKEMNTRNLPILNKYSDHKAWETALRPLLPAEVGIDRFIKVLTYNETITQVLIRSRTDIEDEVHENVLESFMILEGECECHVGDQVVRLRAGDYFEVPLHVHHDVRILSEYVTAVMQRVTV